METTENNVQTADLRVCVKKINFCIPSETNLKVVPYSFDDS